ESRALAGAMMRWRPTVVVDLHSTTSQYFFPPVAQAINQNLPATSFRWFERFGRGNAEAFDARGWQYFVRDEFDFFYPGYIDEWPTMHGATGMTFESDGGPELRKRKDDGTYMTFEMGIAHHFVASLATLTTAAAARSERLRDYYDFHASGMAQAKNRPLKRVIFLPNPDPLRAYWLAGLLVREDIEVSRTTQPVALQRATSYLGGAAGKRTLPAGSYVVDLIQPEARLATALLEPRAVFDSTFVHDEQAKYDRNKRRGEDVEQEGYDFYDITAWTLPLAQGIEAYWTDEVVPAGVRVTPADTLPRPAPPAAARSAYLFTDETEAGARLAMQLLHEGFHVAIATRPLMADGVNYPRGTFVARVQRNPVTLHERISALATDIGVPVAAVRSAFPDSGQAGVGSESVTGLHAPRILLAGGDGIDQTAFGAIWYYLEREIRYPVVPINLASVGKMNLTDYNVLIIPSGSPSRLWRELGEDGAERLKAWVRAGGCVIVSGDAVGLLSRKEVALTTARSMGEDEDDKKETKDIAKDTVVADRGVPAPPLVSPTASGGVRPEFIPGAIFRATLDRTHWLTFGYERDQLPVFLNTGSLLKPSEKGANPVAFVGSDLTLAGFTWPNNTEKYLRGSVWAAVETVGDGHVVAFADDPLFRGFWRGTAKLVTNAILFGPGR
ncbi:MAG: hypothetical protein ABJD11_10395, partial [Gemmatimonadota bacterium]